MRDYVYTKLKDEPILLEREIEVEEVDNSKIQISFPLFDENNYPEVEQFYCEIVSPHSRFKKVKEIDFVSNNFFQIKIPISKLSESLTIELFGVDSEMDIIYRSDLFEFELDYSEAQIELFPVEFKYELTISEKFNDLLWFFEPGINNIKLYVNRKYNKLINVLSSTKLTRKYKYVNDFLGMILLTHYRAIKKILPFKRGVDFIFENEENIFNSSLAEDDFMRKIKEEPNFFDKSIIFTAEKDAEEFLENVFPYLYTELDIMERTKYFYQYFSHFLLEPIKDQILNIIDKI